MVSERATQQKILVAVDFGTSFSGVAWGRTGEAGAQNIIQHWPDKNSTELGLYQAKTIDYVPTTRKYDQHGKSEYKWGYQIRDSDRRHEWFKLDLDPSMQRDRSSLARKYPGSTRLPLEQAGYEISAAKLATDYLRALYYHVEAMLLRTVTEAALRRMPREYIITVPAVWTDAARELTSNCAVGAGMGPKDKLHVISEPEAAAMYAFKEMKSWALDVNDTFILCDCGGGTVDLISYTVVSLDPILQLEEAAPGIGDACGSTFLNRIFAKTLNERFKGDAEWETDKEILDTAMEHFETKTKINFNGGQGDYIPVHGVAPQAGVKKGRLTLSHHELTRIFEPVITEIVALIREQMRETEKQPEDAFAERKTVKLVLLVGGFGNSFYLFKRIQDTFGPNVEVKVAPNCQTAVVRGALMKGLAEVMGVKTNIPRVRVEARKARKHYGTECYMRYRARRSPGGDGHSPERKKWLEYNGEWHVQYMKWFLKKGETTRESEPATFEFVTEQLVSRGPPDQISTNIYCYPDHRNTGAPEYKTNDVVKLGSVTADIRNVDPVLFKKEPGQNGQEYYILGFDIEMKCFAAKIEFTPVLRDAFNGTRRFAPMKIKYD